MNHDAAGATVTCDGTKIEGVREEDSQEMPPPLELKKNRLYFFKVFALFCQMLPSWIQGKKRFFNVFFYVHKCNGSNYWKCNFLMNPDVRLIVNPSLCLMILEGLTKFPKKGGKLHFHASIGEIVVFIIFCLPSEY